MNVIRYYNNAGYKDNTLVEQMRQRPDGKHYHFVEQGRKLSEQKVLLGILKNLKPGTVIQTEDLTTLVAGSVHALIDVIAEVVKKGGAIETASGERLADESQGISIAALDRYRVFMRSAIRRGLGRPRETFDLDKAKLFKAQGLSINAIARQLGCSWHKVVKRLAEDKAVGDVFADAGRRMVRSTAGKEPIGE